jgi:putative transposase
MIRRVQFSLNDANAGKLSQLDQVLVEAVRVVNLYIQTLWMAKDFSSKFVDFKVDTWLSARLQQALGKQALEIVKSQRKRKKKTMPVFQKQVINLDSRFLDIRWDQNSFDVWFKLHSLGGKIILKLPARKHKHLLGLLAQGYTLKTSGRLRKCGDKYFLDLYAEKAAPAPKTEGASLGLDCGYKTLLADSNGNEYGQELEAQYEKISRKRQGSKAFKVALKERDNLINRVVNLINLSDVKILVIEALKNVKHATKGRMRKKFNNKLQRWSYPKVLGKLSRVCEEAGISLVKVDPAYTSQTCSLCGHVDKTSRRGKLFICSACGYETDADLNAAVNIRNRGVYSPPALA